MSAAIHGAEIMVQCSRNDSEQIDHFIAWT